MLSQALAKRQKLLVGEIKAKCTGIPHLPHREPSRFAPGNHLGMGQILWFLPSQQPHQIG